MPGHLLRGQVEFTCKVVNDSLFRPEKPLRFGILWRERVRGEVAGDGGPLHHRAGRLQSPHLFGGETFYDYIRIRLWLSLAR